METVQLQPIPTNKPFLEGARKQALFLACSPNRAALLRFFHSRDLPFEAALVREQKNQSCHVFYRPTVPGFRAHAESDPVTGLRFTLESRAFLARRQLMLGDSLDIARTLLKRAQDPLTVNVHTMLDLSAQLHDAATSHHFPFHRHAISVQHNPAPTENIWAQDYLKSGHVGGQQVWLIPHRAFEGKPENGKRFGPMMDSLEDEGKVRSKLSWDGGDLLILRHPEDAQRLLLFYGSAGKAYWGDSLSVEEYGYVLRVEFGADAAVYAGELASHVDYAMNVLPDGRTILLAKPMTGSFSLSVLALNQLLAEHGRVPVLAELDNIFADEQSAFVDGRDKVKSLIKRALDGYKQWPRAVDLDALERAKDYARRHCPEDIQQCVSSEGLARMIRAEPELASEWVGTASFLRMGEVIPPALLGILASQIAEPDSEFMDRRTKLRTTLETIGYRVIDVPSIAGNHASMVPWAGISYTNFLAIGQEIFMPVFGLGQQETLILSDIQRRLPAGYQIVPVFARYALASNGGVHCVAGVMRAIPEQERRISSIPEMQRDPLSLPDFLTRDQVRITR